MPIQGFVRLRRHQFGRQASFGTRVAAVRAYPFKGVPAHNLNWTDPDIDVGSIDPVAAPYRLAPDLTAPLTDPALRYNSLPLMLSGIFGGGITPTGGGTAKTWAYAPASVTVDDFDVFTYEFGDDVVEDWFQDGDGILESLEISGPEGLGPLTVSMGWRFGSIASSGSTDSPDNPTVPTALDVDPNEAIVYLKDGAIYIADDPYDLDAGQITDALHSFVLRVNQTVDQKRFANGAQTFDIDAYGRGPRTIELEATYAKTTQTVGLTSESDDWMLDQSKDRYISVRFESTSIAETPSTPYSWNFTMPARYYTRTEGEVGGNTVVVLTAHAFYDATTFDGVFTSDVVNTLTNAEL